MKRSSILVAAALSLFSVITVQACSGDEGGDNDRETPGLNPFTGGTGGAAPGTGTGGAAPVATNGGTGNVAEGQGGAPVATNGGTTGTSPVNNGGSPAGLGGAPTGLGGAPAGTGGTTGLPPGSSPECIQPPSPSDGVSCTVTCTDLCGIQNLGSRVCACPGAEVCDPGQTAPCYDCASCAFTAPHPLLDPPAAPLTNCVQDDDGMEGATPPPCDTANQRCQSVVLMGTVLVPDPERFCGCLTAGGDWDCDTKPANFP